MGFSQWPRVIQMSQLAGDRATGVVPYAKGQPRLAIASCEELIAAARDPSSCAWTCDDERLLYDALLALSVPFDVCAWDDPAVDWTAYDLVCVRTTWDYSKSEARAARFHAWLLTLTAAGVEVANSECLLRWNSHKRYLLEIAAWAAENPTSCFAPSCCFIPTALVRPKGHGDDGRGLDTTGDLVRSSVLTAPVNLPTLIASRGWEGSDVMIKPAVGGGSRACLRVAACDAATVGQSFLDSCVNGLPGSMPFDVLVQPFVPGVARGELSVVIIDGAVSHMVRKVPRSGDFRCQEEFGADSSVLVGASKSCLASLASRVLQAAMESAVLSDSEGKHQRAQVPLFARVDLLPLLPDCSGILGEESAVSDAYALLEVELIEPSLYLRDAALAGIDAAGTLARAIQTRLAATAEKSRLSRGLEP